MGIDAQLVASLREAMSTTPSQWLECTRSVVPALGGTSPIEPTEGAGFRGVNV